MGLDTRAWLKLIAMVGLAVVGVLSSGGTPLAAAGAGLAALAAFIDKTVANVQAAQVAENAARAAAEGAQ